MEGEHLDRLAEDIATNGLHDPIVTANIDGVTMLIDGQNRRLVSIRD